MLLIVLPVVWCAVVLVTLVMLRTVALSDDEYDLAVARWVAQEGAFAHDAGAPADAAQPPLDGDRRGRFRATG